MDEIISDVNASPEQTVDVQSVESIPTAQVESPDTSVKAEVAEPIKDTKPVTPVVQTPEENSKFAEQRRAREAAEAKAASIERDYNISKTYGAEYGMHSETDIKEKYGMTVTEFQEAIRVEEMRSKGIDPDEMKKYAEELPIVKTAREFMEKQELEAKRNADFKNFLEVFPDIKPDTIPVDVWAINAKGIPLRYAYAEYALKQQKVEAEKVKANETTAKSSMGSVVSDGASADGLITLEAFEQNKNDQKWVIKNLSKIHESRTKLKW